jgi:hypothetical protein
MTETAQAEPLSERRLRIVHCFRNPIGGLFRHVRDLCHAQSAAGHSVGIICDSTTGGAFEDALFAELAPTSYMDMAPKAAPMPASAARF